VNLSPGVTVGVRDPPVPSSEYIIPWDVYLHGVTVVLAYRKIPYQEMYIVETGAYGKALVLDGKWQSSVEDEFMFHEPLVQPAVGRPICRPLQPDGASKPALEASASSAW